jgi:hypothetical protein
LNFLKQIDAQVPEGLDVHIVSSWIIRPPTRHPRSNRGSPAGRTIMSTSRRLPRHGSIRSSAGSLNSPESSPARCSHLRQAPRGPASVIHRPAQQEPEALQMDRVRGPDFWTSVKRLCHKAQQTLCGEL